MDFTKLGLGPKTATRTETAVSIEPKDADGQPVALSSGETLRFDILLPNTPEGQREIRKWGLRSGAGKEAKDFTEASEDELDAAVERDMAAEADLAARIVRGWNLVEKNGQPVECSLENRRAFFGHFVALRSDTIAQMNAQVEALGNAKKP